MTICGYGWNGTNPFSDLIDLLCLLVKHLLYALLYPGTLNAVFFNLNMVVWKILKMLPIPQA